jgi:uncharacterized protein YprB with RNaseH-like and TPR domain
MRLENTFIHVPGIGEKTEKKLWRDGVRSWDEAESADRLSEGKRSFIQKSRRNLEVGNTVFFGSKLPNTELWRMYEDFSSSFCFFDIETTGLDRQDNRVTTVSFHRNGEDRTLVRGEDLNAENLREEVHEASALVSFNGKRFDQPFLEHNFDIEIEKPHIDLMYMCRQIGLSGGLKPIEKQLGVERELEDLDGREAVRLWKEYERSGREEALEKLVRYNRYDARNLREVMETVRERLIHEKHPEFTSRE